MTLCLLLPMAALASSGPSPAVIYDNTKTYLHHGMQMMSIAKTNSAEIGDEVRLAGTEREVVELKVRFWYTGIDPASFDARVRFRTLRNDKLIPGPAVVKDGKIVNYTLTPTPGDTIYESDMIPNLPVVAGMNEYTFVIPHVKVPDRFVWTIQGYNGKGFIGELGPAYYDKPTIGSSEDFFWHSDMGSPWIAYSWGADPVANFGARITAVGSGSAPKGNPVIPPAALLR